MKSLISFEKVQSVLKILPNVDAYESPKKNCFFLWLSNNFYVKTLILTLFWVFFRPIRPKIFFGYSLLAKNFLSYVLFCKKAQKNGPFPKLNFFSQMLQTNKKFVKNLVLNLRIKKFLANRFLKNCLSKKVKT